MSRIAAGALVAAVLCGCGGSSGGLQREDPAKVLTEAGAAVAKLQSVSATLKFVSGTITFEGYGLVSATAMVRLPDTSDTKYTVRRGDAQIGLEAVIDQGRVWLRLPFLGFQEETGSGAAAIPDLAKLFDPGSGLPAVIPAAQNPKYLGVDAIAGVDSHRIEATYAPEQIHGMLSQLVSAGNVDVVVWVGGSDHLIRRAVLTGPFGDNGTDASIEVDLAGFDKPVTIASPTA